MGIISFESFALVCIFVALGAYLVWQQVKTAGRNIEATLDSTEEDVVQAQVDEAWRRRMLHNARLENNEEKKQHNSSFHALGITPYPMEYEISPIVVCSDCISIDLVPGFKFVTQAASMEPFCGEGRKKRERKQESGPSAYDPYAPITFAAVADSEPSLQSSHSSHSGHGGSFDGGGASGDWGGSSSGSSSSSDCSSNSSDSSSSSCSSSD